MSGLFFLTDNFMKDRHNRKNRSNTEYDRRLIGIYIILFILAIAGFGIICSYYLFDNNSNEDPRYGNLTPLMRDMPSICGNNTKFAESFFTSMTGVKMHQYNRIPKGIFNPHGDDLRNNNGSRFVGAVYVIVTGSLKDGDGFSNKTELLFSLDREGLSLSRIFINDKEVLDNVQKTLIVDRLCENVDRHAI